MIVTLDASVWLCALSAAEHEHARCAALIRSLLKQRIPLHQPGLFVIEVCATIARRTGDAELAREAGNVVIAWPHLELYELHHQLAVDSADIAARCALRGADAVYVATARAAGATLLTLDREMRERASHIVSVSTPQAWLS